MGKAEGRDRTPKEAEKRASDRWDEGKTSSTGCFVSTACIEAKGLPDDCEELNCLRQFRDEYVSALPNGSELVKEYYEKVPLVVSAINRTQNPKKIYSTLFEELVSKTVGLIKSGRKREAFDNCVSIIRDLEQKYLR